MRGINKKNEGGSSIMNEQRILLMFCNAYDIPAQNGQSGAKGCTLNYYFVGQNCDQLKKMEDRYNSIGYQRAKCSIDFDKRAMIPAAPAVYDAQFEMSVGSDGKPVLKVVDLKYVSDVEFTMKQPAGQSK